MDNDLMMSLLQQLNKQVSQVIKLQEFLAGELLKDMKEDRVYTATRRPKIENKSMQ